MMNDFDHFLRSGAEFLPGNEIPVKLGLLALLLGRNVLIEDVPGMGKTTLVKFFAKVWGLELKRIQFTSDLMPSDILGISVFNKETESFQFRPGPIFGELILADELNRGTPKTQSALLEAMEEKYVTMDGESYPLPERFCLFATQNPRGQFGTYPLPESQLDRFLFKFSMGELSKEEEIDLLASGPRQGLLKNYPLSLPKEHLKVLEAQIRKIKVSQMLLKYIADVLHLSRHKENQWGLSPRAGLDLVEAARAWAFCEKRDFVVPDDVQAVFPYVAGHRMFAGHSLAVQSEHQKAKELISAVPIFKGP